MPQIPTLTPIATEPISVVLIVKDAASHLQATLNDWIAYLNGLDRPYEILLVDDKSRDASVELANLIAATSTCVRVLPTLDGGGDGAAPARDLHECSIHWYLLADWNHAFSRRSFGNCSKKSTKSTSSQATDPASIHRSPGAASAIFGVSLLGYSFHMRHRHCLVGSVGVGILANNWLGFSLVFLISMSPALCGSCDETS